MSVASSTARPPMTSLSSRYGPSVTATVPSGRGRIVLAVLVGCRCTPLSAILPAAPHFSNHAYNSRIAASPSSGLVGSNSFSAPLRHMANFMAGPLASGPPEIESCCSVAGEDFYLLLVRVKSPGDLERLLQEIRTAANVTTRTTVVLSTPYEGRPPQVT